MNNTLKKSLLFLPLFLGTIAIAIAVPHGCEKAPRAPSALFLAHLSPPAPPPPLVPVKTGTRTADSETKTVLAANVPQTSQVTFVPSGTPNQAQNVFSTWASLAATVGNATWPLEIQFDLSKAGCAYTMPATTTAFMSSWLTYSSAACGTGGASPTITFPTGAVTTLPKSINNLWISNSGSTSPFSFTGGTGIVTTEMHGHALMECNGATAPLINYATTGGGDGFILYMYDGALLNECTSTTPVINVTGASGFMFLDVYTVGFSAIGKWTLGAPTATQVEIGTNIATTISLVQPSVLSGTINPFVYPGTLPDAGSGSANLVGIYDARPDTATTGVVYFATDQHPYVFTDAGWQGWDLYGRLLSPPRPLSTWTQVNFLSGVTLTNAGDSLILNFPNAGVLAGDNASLATQTLTSIPYTLTAHFAPILVQATFSQAGICITDGTQIIAVLDTYAVGAASELIVAQRTAPATFHANAKVTDLQSGLGFGIWFQIQNTGTSRNYSILFDGITPTLLYTEAAATFLTESNYGIIETPVNSGGAGVNLDSIQVTYP